MLLDVLFFDRFGFFGIELTKPSSSDSTDRFLFFLLGFSSRQGGTFRWKALSESVGLRTLIDSLGIYVKC